MTSTSEVCPNRPWNRAGEQTGRFFFLTRARFLGIIQSLQHLHDELKDYHAPPVQHPSPDFLKPAKKSMLSSFFRSSRSRSSAIGEIPSNLPRGLYLYGDVGSGKTMLMDLFYYTLPPSVKSKTRIHFHNFMQDVHRRLHKMKMEHGVDADAVPFVAADIATQGNVLCFDEFQCTDVADAMILRRYDSAYIKLMLTRVDHWLTNLLGCWKHSCPMAWFWSPRQIGTQTSSTRTASNGNPSSPPSNCSSHVCM